MTDYDQAKALLDNIWEAMDSAGLSYADVEGLSGINRETIRAWRTHRTTPSLIFLVPVLRALGLRISITKKEA